MLSSTESLESAFESFDVDAIEKLLKSDFQIENPARIDYSVLHTLIELIESTTINKSALFKKTFIKTLNHLDRPHAVRRIVKLVVESREFNVDSLTVSCETALHFVVDKLM